MSTPFKSIQAVVNEYDNLIIAVIKKHYKTKVVLSHYFSHYCTDKHAKRACMLVVVYDC